MSAERKFENVEIQTFNDLTGSWETIAGAEAADSTPCPDDLRIVGVDFATIESRILAYWAHGEIVIMDEQHTILDPRPHGEPIYKTVNVPDKRPAWLREQQAKSQGKPRRRK